MGGFGERGFVVVPGVVPAEVLVAANRAVDGLLREEPPGEDVRGPHFYFEEAARHPALAVLRAGRVFAEAERLTGAGTLEVPWQVQISTIIPPFPHRPGAPHIDGFPPEPDGRPGTFTLLAGVLLSDQTGEDAGNLWVWPGSHLEHAAYFREHGPEAFFSAAGYPPVKLGEPEQIRGKAGDLVLAHYLLGHNIGGNTAATVRRAAYFRIKRKGHDARWRDFLTDPWLDFPQFRGRAG